MAVIVTSVILCLINLILWIVLAIRFKKIFSTEEIIDKTRNELNRMISDVNRNAERNITLIDERIKQLKAASAEADRRIALAKSELEKKEYGSNLNSKLSTISGISSSSIKNNSRSGQAAFAEKYRKEQVQGDLFVSAEKDQSEKKNTSTQEENDSRILDAKSSKIPLVTPEVYMTDIPVEPKKSFNDLVKEKSQQGKSVEEIAKELGASISEVKLSLEF